MSTILSPVSDMLVTVKSREVQRGMLAEMRGEKPDAERHLLAAAHLEMVLANDYEQAGAKDLSIRSRISAASCFWRAGRAEQAKDLLDRLAKDEPAQVPQIQALIADLEQHYPKSA